MIISSSEYFSPGRSGPASYHEILRVPSLSAGIYRLAAGAHDPQSPHTEDEIYYVLSGSARFVLGDTVQDIAAGDFIYVPAGEPHRFTDIQEALDLLVVFAPAEGTERG